MKDTLCILEPPEQTLYGLHMQSGDRTQSRDIPALSAAFYARIGGKPGAVLPLYVVSKSYDAASGCFTLFVGDDGSNRGLEQELLPAGVYARLEVRPRLGLLWGPAIGAAKRWFYTRWLPGSGYEAVNLEYELHTEKSVGKHPSVALLFAIREKAGGIKSL